MYSPINENARQIFQSRATGLSLKAASTSDRVQKFVPSLSEKGDRETPLPDSKAGHFTQKIERKQTARVYFFVH